MPPLWHIAWSVRFCGRLLLIGRWLAGHGSVHFVGGDLCELKPGQVCIEPVWILGQKSVQRVLVADLQRELVVLAGIGLTLGATNLAGTKGHPPRRGIHKHMAPADFQ